MKLATYYRVEENHFCRLLSLDETDLEGYEKIYFFSEVGRKLLIPEVYRRANNVIYGGSAFTNGKYIPFENRIIDYTIPRVSIYQEYLKQKYLAGAKNFVISHALDDTYYRMYAGEDKLPIPPVKPRQRVYLFDRDFFYPDWQEIIQDISDRKTCGIYRIHPIVCHTLTDFFNARQCNKLSRDTFYILDLNIPLEEVGYMINHYKNFFLADIVKTSNVFLPLNNNLITNDAYANNIVYTLNLLYSFWAKNIPMKIYVEDPLIGESNQFIDLEKAIMNWSCIKTKNSDKKTIQQRISRIKKLSQSYDILIQKKPQIKSLFNQTYEELVRRGYWKI